MAKQDIVLSIESDKLNKSIAEELKKLEEFKAPEWSFFVKTGVAKERIPQDPDFWYKRAASILRQIYIKKIVGVNRLRIRYGGRKTRGMKPAHFRKGGGKIIRTILQQSEKAGFLEKIKGKKSGRSLTDTGKKFLENIAKEIK